MQTQMLTQQKLTNKELETQFWDNFESWISYWRLNIHRFVEEYLGIRLEDFQKIILYCMSKPDCEEMTTFDWFASRGLGKIKNNK